MQFDVRMFCILWLTPRATFELWRERLSGHGSADQPEATEHWRSPQFGTQVKFRWSRDHNRTAENAFSAPWYFSEMELEPVAG